MNASPASRPRRTLAATFAVGAAAAVIAAGCTNGGGRSGRTTTTGPEPTTTGSAPATTMGHDHGGGGGGGHDHEIPARLDHDPTPEQIEAAIKLVEDTKSATEKYRTVAQAEAAGYNNIGDYQHYTHKDYREDGIELDPNRIESLVYNPITGQLQAAMYNMEPATTLDNVVDLAGNWTVWHIHDNLCWKSTDENDPGYTELGGVVGLDGQCTMIRGTNTRSVKHEPVLMLHVWVVPNRCGPFASIPGLGEGSCLPDFPNP